MDHPSHTQDNPRVMISLPTRSPGSFTLVIVRMKLIPLWNSRHDRTPIFHADCPLALVLMNSAGAVPRRLVKTWSKPGKCCSRDRILVRGQIDESNKEHSPKKASCLAGRSLPSRLCLGDLRVLSAHDARALQDVRSEEIVSRLCSPIRFTHPHVDHRSRGHPIAEIPQT